MGQKLTKAPKSAGLLRDGKDLENTEAARSSAAGRDAASRGAVIGSPVASPIGSAQVATTTYITRAVELPQNRFGGRAPYLEGRAGITRTITTTVVRSPQSGRRTVVRRVVASPQSGRVRYVNTLSAPPPSNEAEVGGHAAVESIPSPATLRTVEEEIAEAGGGAVALEGLAPDSDEEDEVVMRFDIMLQKFVPVRRVKEWNAPRRCRDIRRPAALPSQAPDNQRAPVSGAVEKLLASSRRITHRTAEVLAGDIPPLVELLQNGSNEEKETASASLVGNQDCFIAEEGVVDRLVKLVSDGEGRQREVAAGLLGFAAQHLDADTKLRVAQDGGVEALLSYIAQHHQSQCVYEGITALWGLCAGGGDSIRSLVDGAGGRKVMSTIVESDNERNQKLAGQLLTWLKCSLSETRNLCKAMDDEARPMCEHVLDRLQSLLDRGIDGVGAVQSRLNALLKSNRGKPAILRIVGARTFADALAGLHRDLDLLDGEDKRDLWTRWKTERSAMVRHLFSSDIGRLVCNLDDTQEQTEVLMLLAHEIRHKKTCYSTEERKFLYAIMARLVGFSGLEVPNEEKWFIARHDVQMDDEAFNRGAFGKIYRGIYMNADVVVKCVHIQSERQRADFLREVKIWYDVSCHPNIAQLYGACHVGDPCFMACKYIAGGSLPEYLYRQPKNGPLKTWNLLLGVTHGLQFLHSKGIVHGDLKGDNVLVDGDCAMLTDFGMSYSSEGTQPDFESLGAIRWRAPELVLEGRASVEADVYSLGMLIVEVVTGRAPWGVADDITVKWHMRNGKFMKKPQSLSDEAWGLVSAMCDFDPSRRMELGVVEKQIQQFAEVEAEASCRLYARAAS